MVIIFKDFVFGRVKFVSKNLNILHTSFYDFKKQNL